METTNIPLQNSAMQSEKDMQLHPVQASDDRSLEFFLKKLFAENPLLGNKKLSEKNSEIIITHAKKALDSAWERKELSPTGKMIIAIAIINIAKNWKSETEGKFWKYIAEQLGFKDIENKLYFILTGSIEYSMRFQDRFFVEDATGRDFYSTVLAHALSPQKSIFAYFDFLFEFYKDNLKWNYVEKDTAISQLIVALRGRLVNNSDSTDTALNSYFYSVQVGIRSLLKRKPLFSKEFTEEILRKIDILFSSQTLKSESYIDDLLNNWFVKKILMLDEKARHGRKKRSSDIAMSYDRIRIQYELLNHQEIVLSIPNIRLNNDYIEPPYAEICCGTSTIRENLYVYGNDYGRTIDEKKIELFQISSFASQDDLKVNVKIICDNNVIYDSGSSLYRDVMIFSGSKETSAQTVGVGEYLLFTAQNSTLQFIRCDYRIPNSIGQMYAISSYDGFLIMHNGKLLCGDTQSDDITFVTSSQPIQQVTFFRDGNEYLVYDKEFSILTYVPKSHNTKRYLLSIEGAKSFLSEYASENTAEMVSYKVDIAVKSLTNFATDIVIFDLETERPVYRMNYCIIDGLEINFDKPYYFSSASNGKLYIKPECIDAEIVLSNDNVALIPFKSGEIKIVIPVISWQIEFSEDIENKKMIWHTKITQQSRLKVHFPVGLTVGIVIGGTPINNDNGKGGLYIFDIGNYLFSKSGSWDTATVAVEIVVIDDKDFLRYKLFDIIVKESFTDIPQFQMEDMILSIQNPYAFIGPDDAKLEYHFYASDGSKSTYILKSQEFILSSDCILPDDEYKYEIYLPSNNIFSDERRLICSGKCVLGDINVFRFKNKAIKIEKVREVNKTIDIKPIFIERLRFIEVTDKYCEGGDYPLYIGTCFYNNQYGSKVPFSSKEYITSKGFTKYMVNPVYILVLNKKEICIYNGDDEGLYIDKARNAITDFEPTKFNEKNFGNPEYYQYEVVEEY